LNDQENNNLHKYFYFTIHKQKHNNLYYSNSTVFSNFTNNKTIFIINKIICICNYYKSYTTIKYIEHLLKFTADESCGKCYPCRIGSFRGYELVTKAQSEDYKIDRELFTDLLETLEIGSLCALGGGVPLPIKNIMQYFASELEEYFNA